MRYETPHLILRTFEPADAAALWLAITESRDTLWPWLPWARDEHLTLAQTSFSIEKFRRSLAHTGPDAPPINLIIGVFDRASGRLLGGTGAHTFRPAPHQAEIGYWTRTSERRRGLCTRAAAAMVSWCFAPQASGGWGLRRVEIVCAGANTASASVCRRLGARQEAHSPAERWIPGRGWDDTIRFGILSQEWDVAAMSLRR